MLSSLLKVRNEDILRLQRDVDNIAYNLVTSVNSIHQRGFVNRTIPIGPEGPPQNLEDSKGKITGIKFFRNLENQKDAAMKIEISENVLADLTNIITALEPNSPGDNRVAIAVSKIQHQKLFDDGTATLEEKYLQTIADIGLQSSKANIDAEQSEGILNQQQTVRERISGVSIDEEAANMIRYQHAYEASAKVLKTADQMFQTVIGLLQR
jgi:flagellar hook-associated protein 1 FlgK